MISFLSAIFASFVYIGTWKRLYFYLKSIFVGGTWDDYIQGHSRRVRFVNEQIAEEIYLFSSRINITMIHENRERSERRGIVICSICVDNLCIYWDYASVAAFLFLTKVFWFLVPFLRFWQVSHIDEQKNNSIFTWLNRENRYYMSSFYALKIFNICLLSINSY